ncbi:unnamed protein product [Heligmosomoides polygyrus]|uniref:HTH cro/C1-type domain-containing protein n=1 Tax=Heligmosomoides polygyrus TaxID=6339 RepID=A0A183GSM5_HELPZ|nr:unnamed protein product [Heligmosomoides polygyrus]
MKDYSDDEGVGNRTVKSATERDGEILADVCDALNTDIFQVLKVVRETKASREATMRSSTEAGQRSDAKKDNEFDISENGHETVPH